MSVAGFLMIMFIQESQYLSVFIDAISGGALVGLIVAVFHEYFGMDQHTEDFNGIAASKVDLVGARNHADKQAGISKKTRKNFTKNKAVQGKLPKNGRDGRK